MNKPSLPSTPFYFIRHGETDWNREGRIMGSTDIPLNQEGIEQAQRAALLAKFEGIKTICYSPLTRTKQTAEIINKQLRVPLFPISELQEVNLGVMEGQPRNPQSLIDWANGGTILGAETSAQFLERILRGLNKALEYPGPVLIVAHGGVYRQLTKYLHNAPENLNNCELMYIKADTASPWHVHPLDIHHETDYTPLQ